MKYISTFIILILVSCANTNKDKLILEDFNLDTSRQHYNKSKDKTSKIISSSKCQSILKREFKDYDISKTPLKIQVTGSSYFLYPSSPGRYVHLPYDKETLANTVCRPWVVYTNLPLTSYVEQSVEGLTRIMVHEYIHVAQCLWGSLLKDSTSGEGLEPEEKFHHETQAQLLSQECIDE